MLGLEGRSLLELLMRGGEGGEMRCWVLILLNVYRCMEGGFGEGDFFALGYLVPWSSS